MLHKVFFYSLFLLLTLSSCSDPSECSCVAFTAAIFQGERASNYNGSFKAMYTSDSYDIDRECFDWYENLENQKYTVSQIRDLYGGCSSWDSFEEEILLFFKAIKKSVEGSEGYLEEKVTLDSLIQAWDQ